MGIEPHIIIIVLILLQLYPHDVQFITGTPINCSPVDGYSCWKYLGSSLLFLSTKKKIRWELNACQTHVLQSGRPWFSSFFGRLHTSTLRCHQTWLRNPQKIVPWFLNLHVFSIAMDAAEGIYNDAAVELLSPRVSGCPTSFLHWEFTKVHPFRMVFEFLNFI